MLLLIVGHESANGNGKLRCAKKNAYLKFCFAVYVQSSLARVKTPAL